MKRVFPIVAGVVVIAAIAGAFYFLNDHASSDAVQTTDDAYVHADFTAVAPQVSGKISQVHVEDNQFVTAGTPLFDIDSREFDLDVARAKAQVLSAEATIAQINALLTQQQSVIAQAEANVAQDKANMVLAKADRQRFTNMAKDGSGTHQAAQQAEAHWQVQAAKLKHDTAVLQSAREQVDVLKSQFAKGQADRGVAMAAQHDAELKQSYAHVTAPIDGIVAQRRIRVGGYAHAGEVQLSIVPLNDVYITANFRETQLANMHEGQKVTLTADAYPGVTYDAHIDSLSPASEVAFSPVPAHNATGNFTKITQRLPVKIVLDQNRDKPQLKMGMSTVVSVQTR